MSLLLNLTKRDKYLFFGKMPYCLTRCRERWWLLISDLKLIDNCRSLAMNNSERQFPICSGKSRRTLPVPERTTFAEGFKPNTPGDDALKGYSEEICNFPTSKYNNVIDDLM